MQSRKYYEAYWSQYDDVVTLNEFRKMLGGLGEVQARRLLQNKTVKSFKIRGEYHIPKSIFTKSLHYRNCSQKTVLYGINSLPKYRKLSKMSMIITLTSDLLGSALRIIGGSFGQILFCRVLFPAIPRT